MNQANQCAVPNPTLSPLSSSFLNQSGQSSANADNVDRSVNLQGKQASEPKNTSPGYHSHYISLNNANERPGFATSLDHGSGLSSAESELGHQNLAFRPPNSQLPSLDIPSTSANSMEGDSRVEINNSPPSPQPVTPDLSSVPADLIGDDPQSELNTLIEHAEQRLEGTLEQDSIEDLLLQEPDAVIGGLPTFSIAEEEEYFSTLASSSFYTRVLPLNEMVPCMDCGQSQFHSTDCNIGSTCFYLKKT
jgi:hypothetical protein